MGRGGRSGGSRSSGGGGGSRSRSSGGRSSSSGRGRSSSSPSRGGRSSSFSSSSFGRSSGTSNHNRSFRLNNTYINIGKSIIPNTSTSGNIRLAIILFFALFVFFINAALSQSDITKSTIEREPLQAGVVTETEYFTDELGWIGSKSTLEKGMKTFYKKTGVQPYLYLLDNVNGNTSPTMDELADYAHSLYDELFEDEAHVLLLFHEYNSSGNYSTYYVAGAQAKTVIDSEAADILLDYVDHYYYSDLDEDDMFASVFTKAADKIMTKDRNIVLPLIIILLILTVIYFSIKEINRRKKEEAEETERILNSDLEKLD